VPGPVRRHQQAVDVGLGAVELGHEGAERGREHGHDSGRGEVDGERRGELGRDCSRRSEVGVVDGEGVEGALLASVSRNSSSNSSPALKPVKVRPLLPALAVVARAEAARATWRAGAGRMEPAYSSSLQTLHSSSCTATRAPSLLNLVGWRRAGRAVSLTSRVLWP